MVPVWAAPLLGAAVQKTWPVPDVYAPEVMVSHELLLAADQLQPPLVETQKLPLPPGAATVAAVALMTYGQDADGAGAVLPACDTV